MKLLEISLKRAVSFEGTIEEQTIVISVEPGDTVTSLYQFGNQCFAQMTPTKIEQIASGVVETESAKAIAEKKEPEPIPEKVDESPEPKNKKALPSLSDLEQSIREGYEYPLPVVNNYGYFKEAPDSRFKVMSFNVLNQTIGIKDVHTGTIYSPPMTRFKSWVDTTASGDTNPAKPSGSLF